MQTLEILRICSSLTGRRLRRDASQEIGYPAQQFLLLVVEPFDDRTGEHVASHVPSALEHCAALFGERDDEAAAVGRVRCARDEPVLLQFRHGAAAPVEPAEQELDRLTPREREILGFLAQGKSNKEIARSLDLAESTVKIHVQNILKKLSLSSRVQAAVFAVENGVGRSA